MIRSGLFTFSTLLLVAAAQEPVPAPDAGGEVPEAPPQGVYVPEPERPGRAVSQSGQFRVTGGGGDERIAATNRGSVALLMEETKMTLHRLIEERDFSWVVPIDVILEGKPGDPPKPTPVVYDLGHAGGRFSLGVRIDLSRGIDREIIDRAAWTVLLYERSLRTVKPEELDSPLIVRPWLTEGLREAKLWRDGRADRRLYEGVLKAGGGFSTDELFEMTAARWERLDGASRLAFRVLSGAMTMALLEQSQGTDTPDEKLDGRRAFRSFCGEVARFGGEMPVLLRRHFPDLNLSATSLAKWRELTLAKLASAPLSAVMTVRETEAAIEDALKLRYHDKEGILHVRSIDEWRSLSELDAPLRESAVRQAEDQLVHLSYRCFPSYRPLLSAYQEILRDLAADRTKDAGARLAALSEERLLRMERAIRARDFLDFIEISEAREVSGEFDDYLRLKAELEERPRPPRKDHVSEVLDRMNSLYERKKPR